MSREELIEKMMDGYDAQFSDGWRKYNRDADGRKGMAAALDVAVGELLGEPSDAELTASVVSDEYGGHDGCVKKCIASRRSRYLKPKSDPAVEAVRKIARRDGWIDDDESLAQIVAAVDKARGR